MFEYEKLYLPAPSKEIVDEFDHVKSGNEIAD